MPVNQIDLIGDVAGEQFQTMLSVGIDQMMRDFENGEPLQIRSAYLKESTDITTNAMVTSIDYGLGKNYAIASIEGVNEFYATAPYYGSDLSTRLYTNANNAQKAVTATVSQHIKSKTTWQRLAKDLNTGTDSFRKDELPSYLNDLEKALKEYGADSKELKSAVRRANKRIAGFTNKDGITRSNLRSSYSRVVKAAEKGESKFLEAKLTKALQQKAINNSERLSKSEISRTYFEAEQRKLINDGDVIGWRSVLSSAHPQSDICNFFAEVDSYGMGAGVSPVAYGNPIGYHPRCICQVEAVFKDDGLRRGRHSDERSEDYLKGLKSGSIQDQAKLKSMLGVKGSENISDWKDNLYGWQEPKALDVLPKELVVKV